MRDTSGTTEDAAEGSLLSRLRVVEQQALSDRATAYAGIHEELVRALDGASPAGSRASAGPIPTEPS